MTAVPVVQSDPGAGEAPKRPRLKLYEAGDELEAAFELLAETDGEMTPEIEELLAEAVGNFDEKAERVALAIREYLATEAAEKAQAQAIAQIACAPHIARAKSAENSAKALKAYLLRELTKAGGSDDPSKARKVVGKRVNIRVQKNSQPSVSLTESLLAVPAKAQAFLAQLFERTEGELVEEKVEYSINSKAAIAMANDPARDLPTEIVVKQGYHVRID